VTRWQPSPAVGLPDALILFDGICVLCAGWVKFIIPRDREKHYRFVPIQSEFGQALALRFGIDPIAPQSNVVIRDGQAWFKADSALRVLRDLPGWRWTAIFRFVPRALRNPVYDLIAQNRYCLFGTLESCLVPTEEIRSRFIHFWPGHTSNEVM
jgi:predicted DCC family thiol-disulfide oxidoreductase YuxK